MNNGAIAFGLVLLSIGVGTWCLTYGVSWIARERFRAEMNVLADEIEYDVIAGKLPDVESIQFAWAKAHGLEKNTSIVSIAALIANELVAEEIQDLGRPDLPSYSELSINERAQMHAYDRRFIDAVRRYVVYGSRLWVVVFLVDRQARKREGSQRRATDVEHLVDSFDRTLDRTKVSTRKGPRISNKLIPH